MTPVVVPLSPFGPEYVRYCVDLQKGKMNFALSRGFTNETARHIKILNFICDKALKLTDKNCKDFEYYLKIKGQTSLLLELVED